MNSKKSSTPISNVGFLVTPRHVSGIPEFYPKAGGGMDFLLSKITNHKTWQKYD